MSRAGYALIGYHNVDATVAIQIALGLKDMGVNVWLDRLDLYPDDDWDRTLQSALADCALFIPLLSPDYVASHYGNHEMRFIHERDRAILPVLIRHVNPGDWTSHIGYHYIDLTVREDPDQYQTGIDALYQQIANTGLVSIKSLVNPEIRYLNHVIGQVESQKTALEFVRLSYPTDTTEEPYRPQPLMERTWGLNGPFVLYSEHEMRVVGDLRQVQATYPQYLLVGETGIGKTTTLQRLVLDDVYQYREEPRQVPLPLYLSLANWRDRLSFGEFLQSQWFLKADILDWLQRGWVNLYLDDFDSLVGERAIFADQLYQWLMENQTTHVVIASRIEHLGEQFMTSLPMVQMEAMTASRIESLVTLILGAQSAVVFWQKLVPESSWEWALRRPLYLSLLLFVYQHSPSGDLPHSPAQLILRWLHINWEREQILQHANWIPLPEVMPTLSQMAFDVLDQNHSVILPRDWVKQYLPDSGLFHILNSAHVIRLEQDSLSFFHVILLYIFAANSMSMDSIHPYLHQPIIADGKRIPQHWDRVLVLLTGFPDVGEYYLKQILDVDPLLAIRALTESYPLGQRIQQEVVLKLLHYSVYQMPDAIQESLYWLDVLFDGDSLAFLLEMMRHGAWEERRLAMLFVRESDVTIPADLQTLLDGWSRDMDPAVLSELRMMVDDAVPVLVHELAHKEWKHRRSAAWALGELGDRAATVALADCLHDRDAPVRYEAISALRRWRDSALINEMVQALLDDDLGVRKVATQALSDMGVVAVPAVLRLLRQDNLQAKRVAIGVLGRLGDVAALPDLLPYLRHDHVDLRAMAVTSLGQIGHEAVIEHLIPLLSDTSLPRWSTQTVSELAQKALEGIGTEGAMKSLRRFLGGGNDKKPTEGTAAQLKSRLVAEKHQKKSEADSTSDDTASVSDGQAGVDQDRDNSVHMGTTEFPDNDATSAPPATITAQQAAEPISVHPPQKSAHDLAKSDEMALSDDALFAMLEDEDWQNRQLAITQLGAKKAKKYLPALLEKLNDADKHVRWATVKALANYPQELILKGLQKALYDTDHIVADAAANQLSQMGTPALSIFVEALRSVSVDTRAIALDALLRMRDVSVADEVRALLHDSEAPHWDKRKTIADRAMDVLDALGIDPDRELTPAQPQITASAISDDPEFIIYPEWDDAMTGGGHDDPDNESMPAESLKVTAQTANDVDLISSPADDTHLDITQPLDEPITPSGDWEPILDDLESDDWETQQEAAKALIRFVKETDMARNIQFIERITAGLGHSDSMIRWVSVESLAWVGDVHTAPLLIQCLHDESWTVRVAIVRALVKIGHASAIPSLIDLLNDDNALVREVAAQGLGEFQAMPAVPHLLEHMDDEGFVVRAAIEALGEIGARETAPILVELLAQNDGELCWTVIEALGKLRVPETVSAIIPYLQVDTIPIWDETGEQSLNQIAALALERIATPEALKALEEWQLTRVEKQQ